MLSGGRSAFLCLGMILSFWSSLSWMPVGGCPHKCTCIASNVDCHGLGLKTVPRDIPRNAERLDLEKNNITRITKTDFTGLKNLRVLHLEENQISVIERGAFQDLKQLERLRLNKNKLQVLPELLFQNTQKLTRLVIGKDLDGPFRILVVSSSRFMSCCAIFACRRLSAFPRRFQLNQNVPRPATQEMMVSAGWCQFFPLHLREKIIIRKQTWPLVMHTWGWKRNNPSFALAGSGNVLWSHGFGLVELGEISVSGLWNLRAILDLWFKRKSNMSYRMIDGKQGHDCSASSS